MCLLLWWVSLSLLALSLYPSAPSAHHPHPNPALSHPPNLPFSVHSLSILCPSRYLVIITLSVFLAVAGILMHSSGAAPAHSTSVAVVVTMFAILVSLTAVIGAPQCRCCNKGGDGGEDDRLLAEGSRDMGYAFVADSDSRAAGVAGSGGGGAQAGGAAGSKDTLNPLQCLASLDFWLAWGAHFCGTGCGLTLLNNMGQIGEALGSSGLIFVACGVSHGWYSVLTNE